MTRYRAAIVGTGSIATAHAQALQAHQDRAELVAVVDIDPARATAFAQAWDAQAWDAPVVAPTVTALLANGGVDLVHLCTPPASHASLATECLRAGVTVLVEKPPTLSLSELDALATESAASGAHLATIFQHRFGAGAARLRAMTAAGDLGRPLLATCATQWYRDDEYFAVPWRGRWETEGGGPTMGHGIHQFDLLLSILGPWEQVTAVAARRSRPVQTEDVSMALVTFADGTLASVVNSVVSPRQESALRFDYEYATVELSHLYGYTDDDWTVTPAPGHTVVATRWSSGDSSSGKSGSAMGGSAMGGAESGGAEIGGARGKGGGESGHPGQLAAVLDALDAGTEPPVTIAETRQTMEFVAALYASAFTGAPVRRGEIGPDHPFAGRMDGTGAPWAAVPAR